LARYGRLSWRVYRPPVGSDGESHRFLSLLVLLWPCSIPSSPDRCLLVAYPIFPYKSLSVRHATHGKGAYSWTGTRRQKSSMKKTSTVVSSLPMNRVGN